MEIPGEVLDWAGLDPDQPLWYRVFPGGKPRSGRLRVMAQFYTEAE